MAQVQAGVRAELGPVTWVYTPREPHLQQGGKILNLRQGMGGSFPVPQGPRGLPGDRSNPDSLGHPL